VPPGNVAVAETTDAAPTARQHGRGCELKGANKGGKRKTVSHRSNYAPKTSYGVDSRRSLPTDRLSPARVCFSRGIRPPTVQKMTINRQQKFGGVRPYGKPTAFTHKSRCFRRAFKVPQTLPTARRIDIR
jgi:hypothetical protein